MVGSLTYLGTSGGIGAVFSAGVRYGIVDRHLENEFRSYDSISGDAYNGLLQAVGKLQEAPHWFHFVSKQMINKPSAFGRYLDRLPEDSRLRWLASYVISRPAAIQRTIARLPDGRVKNAIERASDVAVMDPIRKAKELLDNNKEKPIVDLTCLDFVVNEIYSAADYEKLRAFRVPLNALTYNITQGAVEILDMRRHGPAAARASSCFVGCVEYNGAQYGDIAFKESVKYDTMFIGPKVIAVNHGKRTWMGDYQAKVFLVAEFGPEAYNKYVRHREEEEAILKRLRKDPDNNLILQPATDIHFATKDYRVIKKTFDAGVREAAKVEQFLERRQKRVAAAA